MKSNLSISKDQLRHYLHLAHEYAAIILLLFLVAIYGFLSWRTLQLMQAEPDQAAVQAELKTVGVPKVDEDVVKKMEQLEDNSVSVSTLFDEARRNPFEE